MNRDDNIRVTVSCYPRRSGKSPGDGWTDANAKSYDMVFNYQQINTETCWDNLRPD